MFFTWPLLQVILVASEIVSSDAKHIYLFTYLANTIPQFFIILAIGTYFCSHVEYILSACVQSPAGVIISLVCWVGLSVSFHLFPFSCSSDVSFAFQDPEQPVSMRLTVSALSHLMRSLWPQVSMVYLLCSQTTVFTILASCAVATVLP